MEPTLAYSNPATEPWPVPPGPPDPPIPPGLLVEPGRRRLVRRRSSLRKWWRHIPSLLVLFALSVVFPIYSITELCIYFFVPAVNAQLDRVRNGPASVDSTEVWYTYVMGGSARYDSEDVSRRFFKTTVNEVDRYRPLHVHAVQWGGLDYSTLDMPLRDLAAIRWWRWLATAFLLWVYYLVIRQRVRMLPLEETADGHFALRGVPMIARVIRTGANSFTISSRRVKYQYILPNGRPVKVEQTAESLPVTARRRPGDPIIVICDPLDLENHRVYDELTFDVEVRVVQTT